MIDPFLRDLTTECLVDLAAFVASTVALWPDGPQDRVWKAMQRLQRTVWSFSTGMPVHSP